MRIALFENLPTGGAKRALHDFAAGLYRFGHTMDLFTLSTAAHDYLPIDEFVSNKNIYDFIPGKHRYFYIENAFIKMRDLDLLDTLCRQIATDMNSGDYDLAFVHHCLIARSPLVLPYLNMPSVYYCQEPSRRHYEPQLPDEQWSDRGLKLAVKTAAWNMYYNKQKRFEESAARKADLLLVNSLYSQSAIKKAYGIEGRVSLLSVDVEKFKPLGFQREKLILTVGRLDPKKGHLFLIESLSKVKNINQYRFMIISDSGNKSVKKHLVELARNKGVTLEIRVGIDEAQLVECYNRACLFVYAPALEPFGLVPLEAAACGLPSVGVAEGGVKETITDGETGLLTRRDTDEFAAAVTKLLDSPDLRDRLGRQALDNTIKKWNPDVSLENLISNFKLTIEIHREKN